MAAAQELLTAYIGLELLSFSLYILVSYAKNDERSVEAGMKYLLLGAFASALLLYGISFIYGTSGSTTYSEISAAFAGGTHGFELGTLIGLTLIVAGLGFKVAAVPFHMWTPDAYEGAPLPITAYLSATSKAAGFALLLRLFSGALMPVIDDWQFMMAALAAITMLVGNLVALQQHNIKRLLAYSSIGQVGYMLMGITALSPDVSSALLLHMTGYVITNLAVFMALIAYNNQTDAEEISRLPRHVGPGAAAGGRDGRGAVLAGRHAVVRRLPDQVHLLPVRRRGPLLLAGGSRGGGELHLALLLPDGHEGDVRDARRRTRAGSSVPLILQGSVVVLALGVFFVGLYPQPLFDLTQSVTSVLFAG